MQVRALIDMKLEKQVVSLELAKKLKELGVKQESYFGWVYDPYWGPNHFVTSNSDDYNWEYSAFTVAELGEMLSKGTLAWWQNTRDEHGDPNWVYSYGAVSVSAKTEADARAKMLVYLLKSSLVEGL